MSPWKRSRFATMCFTVAQRLEDALGDEQGSFIDRCPAELEALAHPGWAADGRD